MNKQDLIGEFNALKEVQLNLLMSKGNDYSGDDRLSNFKEVGMMVGIPPEMVCRVLMGVKIAKLKQLLSGAKEVKHESIMNTVIDLNNYSFLLRCILLEEAKQASPMPKTWQPEDDVIRTNRPVTSNDFWKKEHYLRVQPIKIPIKNESYYTWQLIDYISKSEFEKELTVSMPPYGLCTIKRLKKTEGEFLHGEIVFVNDKGKLIMPPEETMFLFLDEKIVDNETFAPSSGLKSMAMAFNNTLANNDLYIENHVKQEWNNLLQAIVDL